jgi:hypothetical protein
MSSGDVPLDLFVRIPAPAPWQAYDSFPARNMDASNASESSTTQARTGRAGAGALRDGSTVG